MKHDLYILPWRIILSRSGLGQIGVEQIEGGLRSKTGYGVSITRFILDPAGFLGVKTS